MARHRQSLGVGAERAFRTAKAAPLWLAIAAGAAVVIGVAVIVGRGRASEPFTSGSCPTLVSRDPSNNEIIVQPGNIRYKTVAEYAAAMAASPSCVIMRVPDGALRPPAVPSFTASDIVLKQQRSRDVAQADASAQRAGIKTRPFTTTSIDDVYDYDDDTPDLVSSQERDADKGHGLDMLAAMDKRMRDWSSYPPSAKQFDSGRTAFMKEQTAAAATQPSGVPSASDDYAMLGGQAVMPPDEDKQELQERAALTEYGPRTTPSFWETPLSEVQAMVDDRNSDSKFKQVVTRTGPNQFAVTKLIPNITSSDYNDAPDVPRAAGVSVAASAQWGTTNEAPGPGDVPQNVAVPDPLFDKSGAQNGSVSVWTDAFKWTPGLERAFAPSNPERNWY